MSRCFLQLASVLVLASVQASQKTCSDTESENETDSGGDPCSYYATKPHHCGCCDTPTFSAAGCCACQQSPVAGNSTWWTSVLLTWPLKARTLRLPGKGIQTIFPSDIAERWPHLTEVDLSQNQLTGSLPPALGHLSNLTYLDLNGNRLSGTLPAELGKLTRLQYLYLHNNHVTGNIPAEFGKLVSLQYLYLYDNELSGGLPAELGNMRSLQRLYIYSNKLSGGLPAELGNMTSLQRLYLYDNQLNGSLPAELGSLTSLERLYLFNNKLSGNLPVEIGGLRSLQRLYLYSNKLSGGLPAELGSLTSLERLYLNSNELSGSLPVELGNMTSLQRLYLYTNKLSGVLPAELGKLTNLLYLHLEGNLFSGVLPAELGNLVSLTHLYLDDNKLSGALPAELGKLTRLRYFDLFNNHITGSLPMTLGNMTSLQRLSLYNNKLSGSLPAELGKMRSLETLYLFKNELSGILPAELGSLASLQALSLSGNQLTGTLPAELGKLTSLRSLYLYGNHFTGSIPPEFGNMRSLRLLRLYDNKLTGALPVDLGRLVNLESVSLSRNQLSGTLPAELGKLRSLQELYLYDNYLTGSIPPEFGNMTSLETLSLHSNHLRGSIPAELGRLSSLRDLRLYGNNLTGALPVDLGRLTHLESLYLYSNELSGTLPAELGSLASLQVLLLHRNQLSGTLPAELGELKSLQKLYLYDNQFTGTLPAELGKLTSLLYLSLKNNQLMGSIPPEFWNMTSLRALRLYDNKLSGTLPAALGRLTNLESIYLYSNELSGTLPAELGSLASLQVLSLSRNQLSGKLPAELGTLKSLQRLYLYGNHFTGSIPPEFGNMTSLRLLQLYDNTLSGSLPAELGKLANLQEIDLSNNELGGTLPAELGKLADLQEIDLSNNHLGGTLAVLGKGNCNFPSLLTLSLSWNQLTGGLPVELGNLTSLRRLSLSMNRLSGSIPAEIMALPSLESLELGSNELSGPLPPQLGAMSNLTMLNLGTNRFNGSLPPELGRLVRLTYLNLGYNRLSGSLPPELGNLTNLTSLRLQANQLTGSLPPCLGSLPRLGILSLHTNQLSGPLPSELGKLNNLWQLRLQSNQFTGALPPQLGKLTNLTDLRLGSNQLSGSLPPELGSLSSLERLYMQGNQLLGGLPPALGMLMSLRILNLQGNLISGSLPPELGNLTRLQYLYLRANRINGSLPPELGNLTGLKTVDLGDNRISGSLPPELGGLKSLEALVLDRNQLRGGLPRNFKGLLRLQTLSVSHNPLFCGGSEAIGELASLTRLELRGCCFQALGSLPASLDRLDLGENRLTEVPRAWQEREQASASGPVQVSLKTLLLDGNRIEHWDTSAVVPLDRYSGDSNLWKCGFTPRGQRLPWLQLETLDVSGNPLGTTLYDFLASLTHLQKLTVLRARDADLQGALPQFRPPSLRQSEFHPFLPHIPHTGELDCTGFPAPTAGFPVLLSLDLSKNAIAAIASQPPQLLVQADLSWNKLTVLNSAWWSGVASNSLQRVDVTGNPALRLPVLLEANGTCPELGVLHPTANNQDWKTSLTRVTRLNDNHDDGDGGKVKVECTTPCPMKKARLLVDTTANESVLCRCAEGQGAGRDCRPCPEDTYSTMSFGNGQYIRSCRACPANSYLQDRQGLCFADCSCLAGYYMQKLASASASASAGGVGVGIGVGIGVGVGVPIATELGFTSCQEIPQAQGGVGAGLSLEGQCRSCGLWKTSKAGSRSEAECYCDGEAWSGLLQEGAACRCPEGHRIDFARRSCVECGVAEICTKSLQPPEVKAGFWTLPPPPEGSDRMYGNFSGHFIWRCDSVGACPGTGTGNRSGSNFSCGLNRTGTACSLCQQGFFRSPGGACLQCLESYTVTRLIFLGLLFASMLVPLLIHGLLSVLDDSSRSQVMALRSCRVSLKQILKFAQTMAVVSILQVEWPAPALSLFRVFRTLSFDLASWMGVACLDAQQQETVFLELAFRWMLPVFAATVTAASAVAARACGQLFGLLQRCRGSGRLKMKMKKTQSKTQTQTKLGRFLDFRIVDAMRVLLFLLQLFYLSVLKNAVLPLTCSPSPNGHLTLNMYPHIICWDDEHYVSFWPLALLGGIFTVLLVVGYPLLLLSLKRRLPELLDEPSESVMEKQQEEVEATHWWAFVFDDYRPDCRSFVLVVVAKDILLNLVAVLLPGLGTYQLLVIAMVSSGYAVHVYITLPFHERSNTLLEACASAAVAVLCVFSAGMGFQSEAEVQDISSYLQDGRSNPAYLQRVVVLVSLQTLSLVVPTAIIAFQTLATFERTRRLLPRSLLPPTEEELQEWRRDARLAAAQLDHVALTVLHGVLRSSAAARRSMRVGTPRTPEGWGGGDEAGEDEGENAVEQPAAAWRLWGSSSSFMAHGGPVKSMQSSGPEAAALRDNSQSSLPGSWSL